MYQSNRKIYGYPPCRRDQDVYQAMNETNRNFGKVGFCLGLMAVGGFVLYRKVSELSKDVRKIKEETGK